MKPIIATITGLFLFAEFFIFVAHVAHISCGVIKENADFLWLVFCYEERNCFIPPE